MGLSPSPVRAQTTTHYNSNNLKTHIVVKNQWWARRLGGPSQSSSPARRLRGRVLPTTQILTNARVTRGDPCLGHVSPIHSPPRCHVSINDSTVQLPLVCQLIPATSAYDPATSLRPCHVSIRTNYTINKKIFCLFDDLNRTVISHSSNVRLNPSELCWVCDDETYAPVRFEVIPSTLNFEQNLIPWIIPTHYFPLLHIHLQ
jgi:hypothetical protein